MEANKFNNNTVETNKFNNNTVENNVVLLTAGMGAGKTWDLAKRAVQYINNNQPFIYFTISFDNAQVFLDYVNVISGNSSFSDNISHFNGRFKNDALKKFIVTYHVYLLDRGDTNESSRLFSLLPVSFENTHVLMIDEVHLLLPSLVKEYILTSLSSMRGIQGQYREQEVTLYHQNTMNNDILEGSRSYVLVQDFINNIITFSLNYESNTRQFYLNDFKELFNIETASYKKGVFIQIFDSSLVDGIKIETTGRLSINQVLLDAIKSSGKFVLLRCLPYGKINEGLVCQNVSTFRAGEHNFTAMGFTSRIFIFLKKVILLLQSCKNLILASGSLEEDSLNFLKKAFPNMIHHELSPNIHLELSNLLFLVSEQFSPFVKLSDLVGGPTKVLLYLAKNKRRCRNLFSTVNWKELASPLWMYVEGTIHEGSTQIAHDRALIIPPKRIVISYLGSAITVGVNLGHLNIIIINLSKKLPDNVLPIGLFYAPSVDFELLDTFKDEKLNGEIKQAIGRLLRPGGSKNKIVIFEGAKNCDSIVEYFRNLLSNTKITTERLEMKVTSIPDFRMKLHRFIKTGVLFNARDEQITSLEQNIKTDLASGLTLTDVKKKHNLYRNKKRLSLVEHLFPKKKA
jgi:thymidine kinase